MAGPIPVPWLPEGDTKTASFTAAKGLLYPVNLASAASDFVVTFPSSPAAGDTFGWYVTAPDSGHVQGVEALSTTNIRGGTSHDNTWSLFALGELLVFRWDEVNDTWQVAVDGRIAHLGLMRKNSTSTGASGVSGNWAAVTADHVADVSIAGLVDTANDRIGIRRKGQYHLETAVQIQAVPDTARIRSRASVGGGTTTFPGPSFINGSGGNSSMSAVSSGLYAASAGDLITYDCLTTNGAALDVFGSANLNTFLRVEERLG